MVIVQHLQLLQTQIQVIMIIGDEKVDLEEDPLAAQDREEIVLRLLTEFHQQYKVLLADPVMELVMAAEVVVPVALEQVMHQLLILVEDLDYHTQLVVQTILILPVEMLIHLVG